MTLSLVLPPAFCPKPGAFWSGAGSGDRVPADANADGEVTAADAEAIVDYILRRQAPDSWFDEESADVVDDGVVDIQDLTQLIKLLTEE